jgi:hypothetical protein
MGLRETVLATLAGLTHVQPLFDHHEEWRTVCQWSLSPSYWYTHASRKHRDACYLMARLIHITSAATPRPSSSPARKPSEIIHLIMAPHDGYADASDQKRRQKTRLDMASAGAAGIMGLRGSRHTISVPASSRPLNIILTGSDRKKAAISPKLVPQVRIATIAAQ